MGVVEGGNCSFVSHVASKAGKKIFFFCRNVRKGLILPKVFAKIYVRRKQKREAVIAKNNYFLRKHFRKNRKNLVISPKI